jgi:D-alanyl-D-alanine carboxypeptidase (penicillin-binding protein 5/6)
MRRLRKPVALLLITCMLLAVAPALPASAEWTPPSTLTAKSVYLVNYDTGTVLYSKDAEKQMFPASITKIMTAILVAEKFHDNLDTVVTVTSDDVNAVPYGSSLMGTGLKAGEQITVRQLLYGLLLPSGNDAAIVLARVTASDGKVATFVDEMNKKAKELGCKGTHYTNPHGFQDANHYSTAKDTFIISKFAMTDKTVGDVLSQIVSTTAYSFRTNKQYYSMVNVNSMLLSGVYYYKYAKGIKTGSTDACGRLPHILCHERQHDLLLRRARQHADCLRRQRRAQRAALFCIYGRPVFRFEMVQTHFGRAGGSRSACFRSRSAQKAQAQVLGAQAPARFKFGQQGLQTAEMTVHI